MLEDKTKKTNNIKSSRAQLTFSLSLQNKEKLARIAEKKGVTMASVLSNWIAEYDENEK